MVFYIEENLKFSLLYAKTMNRRRVFEISNDHVVDVKICS